MLRTLTATIIAGLLLAGSAQGQVLLEYNDVRALAQRDEKASPPEYVEQLVTFYTAFVKKTLPACAQDLKDPKNAVVSVVSRIDAKGKILHTWHLGTPGLADCFVEVFRKDAVLPPPPFQPYYTIVDMRGDPAEL